MNFGNFVPSGITDFSDDQFEKFMSSIKIKDGFLDPPPEKGEWLPRLFYYLKEFLLKDMFDRFSTVAKKIGKHLNYKGFIVQITCYIRRPFQIKYMDCMFENSLKVETLDEICYVNEYTSDANYEGEFENLEKGISDRIEMLTYLFDKGVKPDSQNDESSIVQQ